VNISQLGNGAKIKQFPIKSICQSERNETAIVIPFGLKLNECILECKNVNGIFLREDLIETSDYIIEKFELQEEDILVQRTEQSYNNTISANGTLGKKYAIYRPKFNSYKESYDLAGNCICFIPNKRSIHTLKTKQIDSRLVDSTFILLQYSKFSAFYIGTSGSNWIKYFGKNICLRNESIFLQTTLKTQYNIQTGVKNFSVLNKIQQEANQTVKMKLTNVSSSLLTLYYLHGKRSNVILVNLNIYKQLGQPHISECSSSTFIQISNLKMWS